LLCGGLFGVGALEGKWGKLLALNRLASLQGALESAIAMGLLSGMQVGGSNRSITAGGDAA
jgi:hypothetical protein